MLVDLPLLAPTAATNTLHAYVHTCMFTQSIALVACFCFLGYPILLTSLHALGVGGVWHASSSSSSVFLFLLKYGCAHFTLLLVSRRVLLPYSTTTIKANDPHAHAFAVGGTK